MSQVCLLQKVWIYIFKHVDLIYDLVDFLIVIKCDFHNKHEHDAFSSFVHHIYLIKSV